MSLLEHKVSAGKQESMHGPFQRKPWFPAALHLTQTESPLSLQPHVGTPFPDIGVHGWGAQCGAESPCSSGGTSVLEISLEIINHYTMGF